jgi:hypothetical protein
VGAPFSPALRQYVCQPAGIFSRIPTSIVLPALATAGFTSRVTLVLAPKSKSCADKMPALNTQKIEINRLMLENSLSKKTPY